MARYRLNRRQRAAASCIGMVPVTVISGMLYFYGFDGYAIAFEIFSVAVYTVWILRAPNPDDIGGNDNGEDVE